MDKGQVAINSDTFHFVPNASNLLEKTHNAIEPIGDQRIVLDVWTRDEIGIQIGAAFIEDLVVYDLERVVDVISVHRSAFSFGLWIRGVPLFGKWCVCEEVPEARRREPLDIPAAEIPKDVVKAGLRLPANDVAKAGLEPVLDCQPRKLGEDRALFVQRDSIKAGAEEV